MSMPSRDAQKVGEIASRWRNITHSQAASGERATGQGLRNGIGVGRLRKEVGIIRCERARHLSFDRIAGSSPELAKATALARKVAESKVTRSPYLMRPRRCGMGVESVDRKGVENFERSGPAGLRT